MEEEEVVPAPVPVISNGGGNNHTNREDKTVLTTNSSTVEVQEWLNITLPEFKDRESVLNACSHLNGSALLSPLITEQEMKDRLGMKPFGIRRKLTLALKELVRLSAVVKDHNQIEEGGALASEGIVTDQPPVVQPSTSIKPCNNLDQKTVENQLNAEASCIGICQWAANSIHKTITNHNHAQWASTPIQNGRLAALAELRAKIELPTASVVLVGNTGAGKSTLLNALIGEVELLPTNGMRACTAVLIELSYKESEHGSKYEGVVEFVSRQEWEMELIDLLSDLTTQEGRAVLYVSEDAHNYDSWCKLYAVYGDSFTNSSIDTGESANGRKVYKAMMVDDLKEKLKRIRTVTHKLGTIERVVANDAREFRRKLERYMDSANDVTNGQYWPLVKRCKVLGRWDVLKSGAQFVDAPGVNDDNSSRDKMVAQYLKQADAIWIVSNINRAVNDKTAKDMLNHRFRQQLLMDGNYGQIVFIATQSDILQRSEVIHTLGLSHESTLTECAVARCNYIEHRMQSDFIDGLVEMSRASGETPDRKALERRFCLPVFCVSAIEHQKLSGVRTADGPSIVWKNADATQIPALRSHVQRATLLARSYIVRQQVKSLINYGTSMLAFCQIDRAMQPKEHVALANIFEQLHTPLRQKLQQLLQNFDIELSKKFDQKIKPRLTNGAVDAGKKCVMTSQQWSMSWTRNGGGGLHWGTYKACCRREGTWRINMNEELASPILASVGSAWESVFVQELDHSLNTLKKGIVQHVKCFHDELAPRLVAKGQNTSRIKNIRTPMDAMLSTRVANTSDKVKDAVQGRQKELSRSLVPVVQSKMQPGYQRGFEEAGIGSHRRRVTIVEDHIRNESKSMFDEAIQPVMQSMLPLRKEILSIVKDICIEKSMDELHENYGILWEATTEKAHAARLAMRPTLEVAVNEACTALSNILRSQGTTSKDAMMAVTAARGCTDYTMHRNMEKGDQDDEYIFDVTDKCQAEALQQKKAMEIDLISESVPMSCLVRQDVANVSPSSSASTALSGIRTPCVLVKDEKP